MRGTAPAPRLGRAHRLAAGGSVVCADEDCGLARLAGSSAAQEGLSHLSISQRQRGA